MSNFYVVNLKKPFSIRDFLKDENNLEGVQSISYGRYKKIRIGKAELSIQRSMTSYCDLRNISVNDISSSFEAFNRKLLNESDLKDISVEIGFPNFISNYLLPYAEKPDEPMDCIYAYVPLNVVQMALDDIIAFYNK